MMNKQKQKNKKRYPIKLMKQDKLGVHKIVKGSTHFLPMEFPNIIKEEINSLQKRINTEKK